MPPEEAFDAVAWVKALEDYLKKALADVQVLVDHDPRLLAIARTQFELGCMALGRAVARP